MAENFSDVYERWRNHLCPSESDVCNCAYQFNCRLCGNVVATVGESMPMYQTHGKGTCYQCSTSEEVS